MGGWGREGVAWDSVGSLRARGRKEGRVLWLLWPGPQTQSQCPAGGGGALD